jgi:hypothetical protein
MDIFSLVVCVMLESTCKIFVMYIYNVIIIIIIVIIIIFVRIRCRICGVVEVSIVLLLVLTIRHWSTASARAPTLMNGRQTPLMLMNSLFESMSLFLETVCTLWEGGGGGCVLD